MRVAPKGVTPAQVAYRDAQRRGEQRDAQYAEQHQRLIDFKGAAETKKRLDHEAAALDHEAVALERVMSELGLVRQ
jgi:hypothetical protein